MYNRDEYVCLRVSFAGEVGTSQPLTLNATGSQDLDGFSTVPFQFTWSCFDVSTRESCVKPDGASLDMRQFGTSASNAVVVLPAGSLRAGAYTFTVLAFKGTVGAAIPNLYRNSRFDFVRCLSVCLSGFVRLLALCGCCAFVPRLFRSHISRRCFEAMRIKPPRAQPLLCCGLCCHLAMS